jgi:ribosomal protein S18 acetylase RimI-like enzyme
MVSNLNIRRAQPSDLPALGRLGAALLVMHHELDRQRFVAPGADPEAGYAWFLGTQLASSDAAIVVAERDGEVLGYVYASIEPHSWKELRDEAGFIHDLMIDEQGRRLGLASRLLDEAMSWLASRGVPRVILWSAEHNAAAQRLFERVGFRRTMVEMTRELGTDTLRER